MAPRQSALRFLLCSALLKVALAASCYFTDGTYAGEEEQPCFPGQAHSGCCGINKKNGDPDDICLSNGLCLAQVYPYSGLILKNACTDQSWDSPDCPNICPKSMTGGFGIHVLPCNNVANDAWCCSLSGEDCCNDSFKIQMGTVVLSNLTYSTTPSSTTTTRSSTATGTSGPEQTKTVTVTATATGGATTTGDTSTEDCAVSETTVLGVGVGVGVGLGLCLATSLAALWFQRRRFNKRLEEVQATVKMIPVGEMPGNGYYGPQPAELPLTKPLTLFELGSDAHGTRNSKHGGNGQSF